MKAAELAIQCLLGTGWFGGQVTPLRHGAEGRRGRVKAPNGPARARFRYQVGRCSQRRPMEFSWRKVVPGNCQRSRLEIAWQKATNTVTLQRLWKRHLSGHLHALSRLGLGSEPCSQRTTRNEL